MSIKPSYMGTMKVGETYFPCFTMSAQLRTKPEFYDHVVGLNDSSYTGQSSKGPGSSSVNRQKRIYRWGPKIGVATASGPITEDGIGIIMNAAINGTEVDVILKYTSGDGHKVPAAKVSSFTLDVKAGEVATWTAEFTGKDCKDDPGEDNNKCLKLVTWDKCGITSPTSDDDVAGFSLSISNPIVPIYVGGTSDLFPEAVRIGMQEVTGTVSTYSLADWNMTDGTDSITIDIADESWTAEVVFQPSKASASGAGPFISTTDFVGASDTTVFN